MKKKFDGDACNAQRNAEFKESSKAKFDAAVDSVLQYIDESEHETYKQIFNYGVNGMINVGVPVGHANNTIAFHINNTVASFEKEVADKVEILADLTNNINNSIDRMRTILGGKADLVRGI